MQKSKTPNHIIFNFNSSIDIHQWRIVDDVVMGGRSRGKMELDEEGFGVFSGEISLENNGGFSSVRYQPKPISVSNFTKIVVSLQGDRKNYQLRIKNSISNSHSYIANFSTTGDWQNISINLEDMYPKFRGRRLDIPNFAHDKIEEIAFLIGNKNEELFKLRLESITLM
ncbi:MAG TPA: CIA30 family protein [Saprospiraceae bacterium]|nr:CIA30 family protein [Saprospiraceae bacterium]HPN68071.1 CIA30 family protein [Saprospiraceae bacterium]